MKVNKSDDALVCFNLLSLFEEVFFVFRFFSPKVSHVREPLGKWEPANANLC